MTAANVVDVKLNASPETAAKVKALADKIGEEFGTVGFSELKTHGGLFGKVAEAVRDVAGIQVTGFGGFDAQVLAAGVAGIVTAANYKYTACVVASNTFWLRPLGKGAATMPVPEGKSEVVPFNKTTPGQYLSAFIRALKNDCIKSLDDLPADGEGMSRWKARIGLDQPKEKGAGKGDGNALPTGTCVVEPGTVESVVLAALRGPEDAELKASTPGIQKALKMLAAVISRAESLGIKEAVVMEGVRAMTDHCDAFETASEELATDEAPIDTDEEATRLAAHIAEHHGIDVTGIDVAA